MCKLITHFSTWRTRPRKLSTLRSSWRRCCMALFPFPFPLIVGGVGAANNVVVVMMRYFLFFGFLQWCNDDDNHCDTSCPICLVFFAVLHSVNFFNFSFFCSRKYKKFSLGFVRCGVFCCYCCCLSLCWMNTAAARAQRSLMTGQPAVFSSRRIMRLCENI